MKKNLSSYPHLVNEWHPSKNGELTPQHFTHGSSKKVWWLCSKGHSFDSVIYARTGKQRNGCPYCAGKKSSEDYNLQKLFPEIAKEWHPTKNGKLTPKECTQGSDKKVWWICPKNHSYYSAISEKTRKKPSGCPYCAGKKAYDGNSLETLFPEVAKEWHPNMNGEHTLKAATYGSSKKAWWLCPNHHSYESTISNRTRMKSGCPYCAGKKATKERNLQILHPEIAKEWHPLKNGDYTPRDVPPASHKKVWWLCPKGHSYNTVVKSRTTGSITNCPKCSNQSSEPEIRILSELKWFYDKINHRHKVEGIEVDMLIPKINIAIEYDGNYWHRNKKDKDLKKNELLSSLNIHLIRVRQLPLKPLSKEDILVSQNHSLEKKDLDKILKKIIPLENDEMVNKINKYLEKLSFVNEELFNKYRSYFPSPFPENSLLETHPQISLEWDYEKNYPLIPENFSHGANHKIWWLCSIGHSYASRIVDRVRTMVRCPYCLGKKTLNLDLFK